VLYLTDSICLTFSLCFFIDSLDKDANYWIHSATSNYLSKWYKFTIDDVNALQKKLIDEVFVKQIVAENKAVVVSVFTER
jgi:hypothetical protein